MMYGATGAGSEAAAGALRPIMPTKAALTAATRERIRMAGGLLHGVYREPGRESRRRGRWIRRTAGLPSISVDVQ
ncbi:hypothetical protein Misp04_22640 [Micromonospora sp. NBRC 101691]|nr:hypothetical protein Misp04_22640 [Micromonospora sp. NBRC 101691]